MSGCAQIPWWRTTFGGEESRRIAEAIANEQISQGPLTAELEERIAQALGVPFAVVTTSGSVALLLSLMALGIGRDDEVIVPDRTWIATAHAPLLLGARVVLVDCRADKTTMAVEELRRKITPRTKAIIPVHLNGRGVEMEGVHAVAREHGLLVVEDACQALFSRNAAGFLGTQSDAGCFSLGVTKLISTGQGGFVVTRDPGTYEKLKLIRNHGVIDNFTDRWSQVGCNFKFTDLQAALGLVQLQRAPGRLKSVRALYEQYAAALADLPFLGLLPVDRANGEVPLYPEVICHERERLLHHLAKWGIQARPSLPSLHTSPYLEAGGEFPHSDFFARHALYLPCGPCQPLENVERVLEALHSFR